MIDEESRQPWPPKRTAALVLTLALAALGIYVWRHEGDLNTLWLLCVGVVLGALYTLRGGTLPAFIHRSSESHWLSNSPITADDDPRNLSPKLYLPILGAAVLIAALFYLHFRHGR